MKINIGQIDRAIRIVLSLGLIYVGFVDDFLIVDTLSSYIIGALGVMNLIVALARFCPLYALTGINTCPEKQR